MKYLVRTANTFKALFFTLVALFFVGLSACENENDIAPKSDAISLDEEIVDGYFEDSDDVVLEINDQLGGVETGRVTDRSDRDLSRCAEITHDPDAMTIVIDFGDGCEGPGGKVRSGKILITYTARKFTPGSVWTYTFEDYYVNGIHLEGLKTITNVSGEETDNISFNKVLEGGKATWPDGLFATREVNKTFTWVKGELPIEDEFHVDGKANGISKSGNAYSMEILETLIYKRACRREGIHIAVAGSKLVMRGDIEAIIDYGDGRCDNIVTISRNGESEEVDFTDRKRLRG